MPWESRLVLLQIFALTFTFISYYVLVLKSPLKQGGDKPTEIKGQDQKQTMQALSPTENSLPSKASGSPTDTLSPGNRQDSKSISNAKSPDSERPKEAIESSDPNVATSLANLATLYEAQGKYKDAEDTWGRVLKIRENAFSKDHPSYAEAAQSIASLYVRTGRYQDAEKIQLEALGIFEKVFGLEHPVTASSLNNLAVIYLHLARYKEAAPLIERALAIRSKSLGPQHPDEIPLLENLLRIYEKTGDTEKVAAISKRIKALKEKFE